jgi:hypothetical protein
MSQSNSNASALLGTQAARAWPESQKDKLIRVKLEERRKIEEEERLKQEEFERQQNELNHMSHEDLPALDAN